MQRLLRKLIISSLPVCILLLCASGLAWSQERISLEGTVIDAATGRPLPGVQVSLEETLALTDGDGRFVLQNVPAGAHLLSFARSGYVRAAMVAESQARNVVVGMTRAGSVSGRLTDERGEPLEGIQVQMVRRTFDEHGTEGLVEGYSTRTNDLGEYRLYWITPGTYFVTARLDDSQDPPDNSNSPVRGHYATSYYPGVVDAENAARLSVTAGAELNGINWPLRASAKAKGQSISGRVIDSRTGRSSGSSVSLIKLTPFGTDTSDSGTDSDGSFRFTNVDPGTYWLRAISHEAGPGQKTRASAQVEISVSDRDIDGVTLTMTSGVTISGRITLEGPFSNATPETLGIMLRPIVGGIASPGPPPRRPKPDGTFTIDSLLPGPYRLEIASLPPEYFLREVRMGPTDVLGLPVIITEAATGALQIVASSGSGELDGIVLNSTRQPIAGIEAILIPDRQRERKELYLKTRTDPEGRFSLRGIPPGNYKLFAWENLEQYGYFDLNIVQQADTQATPVRVTESSTQSIEVRSIP
jgi:5-hydroxyisourate hydrolase-like protein (transthyretin family)